MDIPAIGKAKGLFEIFIPGVFLLLNFTWMLYCFQYTFWNSQNFYSSVKENQILMLVVIIVFGYLTGVILWLARADLPDELSSKLRRFFGASEEFYKEGEDFPYIKSLNSVANTFLLGEAGSFCSACWTPRASNFKNKYFFNYCKILINAVDEKSATEIYSSEALIRYLAAMFYALLISPLFMAAIILFTQVHISFKIDSLLFIIFYLLSLLTLLWHFRYMRFKEVQTVFTASLINKESIDRYLSINSQGYGDLIVNEE